MPLWYDVRTQQTTGTRDHQCLSAMVLLRFVYKWTGRCRRRGQACRCRHVTASGSGLLRVPPGGVRGASPVWDLTSPGSSNPLCSLLLSAQLAALLDASELTHPNCQTTGRAFKSQMASPLFLFGFSSGVNQKFAAAASESRGALS
ncbi:hypothetical protein SKAU_G00373490 [Synaphobranchus kaupii]|uniref:Uncharacterized protein n=1 Tax=Synaphobranchus kaupii TaxID=118154 RepID=A0A9Q1IE30_SYNKA|nr:hypothetical protein SKAU_G00373490 [Synaphobranchus kaupii]